MKFLLGAFALAPVVALAQTPTTEEMTRQMREQTRANSARLQMEIDAGYRQVDSDMKHLEQMDRLERIERLLEEQKPGDTSTSNTRIW